jgi:hypothetical protein
MAGPIELRNCANHERLRPDENTIYINPSLHKLSPVSPSIDHGPDKPLLGRMREGAYVRNTPKEPYPRTRPYSLHTSMWLFEVLSLALAATILVAVIIVLARLDGKHSPTIGSLTLNAMIAIAATSFRLFLMVPVATCLGQITWTWLHSGHRALADVITIDMASRGPIGSLELLLKFKYK